MNPLELEQEIGKIVRAMMTRNTLIGSSIIAHLKSQLTHEDLAGVLLVSIERLVWFDADSVIWSIENLIPVEVLQEIQRIMSFTIYKQLIFKGCVPGKDMSVDACGKILLTNQNQQRAAA